MNHLIKQASSFTLFSSERQGITLPTYYNYHTQSKTTYHRRFNFSFIFLL